MYAIDSKKRIIIANIAARQFILKIHEMSKTISKEGGVNREKEKVSTTKYHKFASDNFRCIYILGVYKIVKNIKCLCSRALYDNLSIYLHILPCVQDC